MSTNGDQFPVPADASQRQIPISDKANPIEEELAKLAEISALPSAKAKEMLLLPENVHGLAILDVGGGASDMTATLLEMGADAHAIDPRYRKKSEINTTIISQIRYGPYDLKIKMLINKTLQRFMASIKASPERYKAASATRIPFPDHSFDIVFSIDTITAFLDRDRDVFFQSMKECFRVTKPGGLLKFLPFQDMQPAWSPEVNALRLSNDEYLLNWLKNNPEVEGIELINTTVKYHHRLTFKKKAGRQR